MCVVVGWVYSGCYFCFFSVGCMCGELVGGYGGDFVGL